MNIFNTVIVADIEPNERNIHSTVINKHFRSRKNVSDFSFANRLVDRNDQIDPEVN